VVSFSIDAELAEEVDEPPAADDAGRLPAWASSAAAPSSNEVAGEAHRHSRGR